MKRMNLLAFAVTPFTLLTILTSAAYAGFGPNQMQTNKHLPVAEATMMVVQSDGLLSGIPQAQLEAHQSSGANQFTQLIVKTTEMTFHTQVSDVVEGPCGANKVLALQSFVTSSEGDIAYVEVTQTDHFNRFCDREMNSRWEVEVYAYDSEGVEVGHMRLLGQPNPVYTIQIQQPATI